MLDSLLGGYETTSLLMAMVVHLLGQSPAASEQLKVATAFSSTHAPCPDFIMYVHTFITKYKF